MRLGEPGFYGGADGFHGFPFTVGEYPDPTGQRLLCQQCVREQLRSGSGLGAVQPIDVNSLWRLGVQVFGIVVRFEVGNSAAEQMAGCADSSLRTTCQSASRSGRYAPLPSTQPA